MTKTGLAEILKDVGQTPEDVIRALSRYSKSARVLSSDHPRLIDSHEDKWIGVHNGKIELTADSFESLMKAILASKIPADEIIVRHITRKEKTMIL